MKKLTLQECDQVFANASAEKKQAVAAILKELEKAEEKFPYWPADKVHQAAIVGEESGELIRAAFQNAYEQKGTEPMLKEAVQTGAMAVRFIIKQED